MSDYSELRGTASRLASEAIEWQMEDLGWSKSDNGWVSTMQFSATSIYELDATGMYVRDTTWDGPSSHVEDFALTANTNFRQIWSDIYDRVGEIFNDWTSLPEPADFNASIANIRDAISVLTLTTEVENGTVKKRSDLRSANSDLDSVLTSFCGEAIVMGGAMDTFALLYSNRLPQVLTSHLAILTLLGANMSGEKNLMKEARRSITRAADLGLQAMQERGGSGGDAKQMFSVVGAVLAGVSLFVTAGTSLAAVVATGRTIFSIFGALPASESSSPAVEEFGGETASEVLDKIAAGVKAINDTVIHEEEIIRDSLTNALTEVTESDTRETYDLGKRPNLEAMSTVDLTNVEAETMVYMGGVLAPFISDNVALARQQAALTPNKSAWLRNSEIGLGSHGPYSNWENLLYQFFDYSSGTEGILREVGDTLIHVAGTYVDTDAVLAQRTSELAGELNLPKFNDSTKGPSEDRSSTWP